MYVCNAGDVCMRARMNATIAADSDSDEFLAAAREYLNSPSARELSDAQARQLIDAVTARLPPVPEIARVAGDKQGVNSFPPWAFWTIVIVFVAGVIASITAGFLVQKKVRNTAKLRLENQSNTKGTTSS